MKYLKEHKKAIIIAFVVIIAYTLNSLFLYSEVNEAKAQLLEAQKPSYVEVQKNKIDKLYSTRNELISANERMTLQLLDNEEFKYMTESMIRCEKENTFNEIKVICLENWKNYSKK